MDLLTRIAILLAVVAIAQCEKLEKSAEEEVVEREKRELAENVQQPLVRMERVDLDMDENIEGLKRMKRNAESDITGEQKIKTAKKRRKRSVPSETEQAEIIGDPSETKKLNTPVKMRAKRAVNDAAGEGKKIKRQRRDVADAKKLSLAKKKRVRAVDSVEDPMVDENVNAEGPVMDLAETLGQVRRRKREARKAIVALELSERRHHEALMRERRELRHKLEQQQQQEEASE